MMVLWGGARGGATLGVIGGGGGAVEGEGEYDKKGALHGQG